jgi:hypothetical protein
VLSENTVAGAISIDDGTGNDVVDDLPIDTVVITAAG